MDGHVNDGDCRAKHFKILIIIHRIQFAETTFLTLMSASVSARLPPTSHIPEY